MQVAEEDPVAISKSASVPGVDPFNDDVQRRFLVPAGGAPTIRGFILARFLLQLDIPFVRLDQLVVVQAQLPFQVKHLYLLAGNQFDQPATELVFLLHIGVEHTDDLADESIPAYKCAKITSELVAVVLVLGKIAVDYGFQDTGHLAERLLIPHFFAGQTRKECVNIPLVIDAELTKDALCLVDEVHVDITQEHCFLVERLEGGLDVLLSVHEIKDVGVVLSFTNAVQTG